MRPLGSIVICPLLLLSILGCGLGTPADDTGELYVDGHLERVELDEKDPASCCEAGNEDAQAGFPARIIEDEGCRGDYTLCYDETFRAEYNLGFGNARELTSLFGNLAGYERVFIVFDLLSLLGGEPSDDELPAYQQGHRDGTFWWFAESYAEGLANYELNREPESGQLPIQPECVEAEDTEACSAAVYNARVRLHFITFLDIYGLQYFGEQGLPNWCQYYFVCPD